MIKQVTCTCASLGQHVEVPYPDGFSIDNANLFGVTIVYITNKQYLTDTEGALKVQFYPDGIYVNTILEYAAGKFCGLWLIRFVDS